MQCLDFDLTAISLAFWIFAGLTFLSTGGFLALMIMLLVEKITVRWYYYVATLTLAFTFFIATVAAYEPPKQNYLPPQPKAGAVVFLTILPLNQAT